MKKQTSFPWSCIMNCSAVKRFFLRIGYMPVIILLMVSWGTTVPISAQAASYGPESDLQEMNLTTEDRVAIEALASSYSKFALAGDFDSWLLLYREDAVRMNPGAPPLNGREAISQWINSMDITVRSHKISVIDIEGTRELAYMRGTFQSELSINLNDEELIIPDEGSWLSVVRRDKQDNWRFYRFITNTDLAPATGPEARNEAAVNTFYSVYNTKEYDRLDAILAPGFRHASVEGLYAFKAYMIGQVHAFQDVHIDVHQSIIEGDSGATQWTLRVTDPATGRSITLPGMSLLRFQNGQIVEHSPYYNPAPLQND